MALQNIEANITLDLYNHDTTPATIKAIQLDSQTRYVAAMLQSMGAQYDIDSGATVQLIVIRPDKVGVQITGTTFTYGDEGASFLGPYAELTQVALAINGKMFGQFKVTSGDQILRTEIFTISTGVALDASTDEWADEYDGYNLEEMATYIETKVNSVKKIIALEATPVTFEMLTGKVIGSTGIITNASGNGYKVSDYIPVSGGQVVTCALSRARWGNQNWAFYDAEYNPVATYGKTASGTTVEYHSRIIVPLKAKYFAFARDEGGFTTATSSDVTIMTKYAEAVETAPKSAVRTNIGEAITETLLTADDATGKVIGEQGNVVSTTSEDFRVSTVSVSNGDVINIRNCKARYANKMYSFFDASGLPIYSLNKSDNDAHDYLLLEVPFGAVTLSVSGYQSYATVSKVTSISTPWTGKKWAMMGDSVTEVNSRATKRYFDYIAEQTGITTVNLGLSGTGYKKAYNSNLPFYQRVDTIPTDSDVITIFGSGNDCSLTLGTPTDTTADTVCGCINLTIDGIRDRIVGANIGIITPTPWVQYPTTTANNNMDLYCDAIVEICRLKGVPCLDLYHCSNMLPWEESFRNAFYKHDEGNGVHPDEDGHKLFAPRIKAFLDTLIM